MSKESYWGGGDIETVETQYADVIRALKFAALDKIVDESYALKKDSLSKFSREIMSIKLLSKLLNHNNYPSVLICFTA